MAAHEPRQVRVRLGDLIDVATIESPLLDVAPARGLEDLDEVRSTPVFSEDFEAFEPPADWKGSPDEIVAVDGGHALRLAARGAGRRAFVVPAEPNAHYVFERRVRTAAKLAADFEVLEVANPKKPVSSGGRSVPRSHWAPEPEPDGTGRQAPSRSSRWPTRAR